MQVKQALIAKSSPIKLSEQLLGLCRAEIEVRSFGGIDALISLDRIADIPNEDHKGEALTMIINSIEGS